MLHCPLTPPPPVKKANTKPPPTTPLTASNPTPAAIEAHSRELVLHKRFHPPRLSRVHPSAHESADSGSINEGDDSDDESVIFIEECHPSVNNSVPFDTLILRPSNKLEPRSFKREQTEHIDLAAEYDQARSIGRPRARADFTDDEDDPEYAGRSKRVRRSATSDGNGGVTPLRALSIDDQTREEGGCGTCGCTCSLEQARVGRGRGSGRNTLPLHVRANILAELLGQDSLLKRLERTAGVRDWRNICDRVGAKREDHDQVRHAARWMQQNLPAMMKQGRLL